GGEYALSTFILLSLVFLKQTLHRSLRRDSAASPNMHAVQSGCGVGEANGVLKSPLLNEPVDKRTMEDVAGPCGVGDGNFEGGRLQQSAAIQKDSALRTACDAHDRAAVTIGEIPRVCCEVGTCDQVVHQPEQFR